MQRVTVEYRPVDSLRLHPLNYREGDVGAIHESIEAHDLYAPLVIQASTGYLISGNHRLIVLKQRGATEVPVVPWECDDAEALRILLDDNGTSDRASNDSARLYAALRSLDSLDGTIFDDDDLDDLAGALLDREPLPAVGRTVTDCPECGHVFTPTMREE